ncbi:MAG: cation:proton antiporter, partial [Vulcanimicrobiaceae bacterium]
MSPLVIGSLLATAWILSIALQRYRVPDILGFLALGMALGSFGFGVIHISLSSRGIGTIIALAASVLLYEAGRGLKIEHIRPAWRGLFLLVTMGVIITAGLAAVAARLSFGWDWQTALLLGAVIAATDPAAVIPVMRQVGMADRVSNIAQAESALNDATGAILTLATIEIVRHGTMSPLGVLSTFLYTGLGGIAIGVATAACTAWIAHSRRSRDADLGAHNQQVVELITVLLAYGVATHLGSSGYMAAFAAGVVHSRTVVRAAYSTKPFFSTMSFLSRLAVFVLLGATFDPRAAAIPILATVAFLAAFMCVIRPLAVFSSLLPDRNAKWTLRELLMLSWVRE